MRSNEFKSVSIPFTNQIKNTVGISIYSLKKVKTFCSVFDNSNNLLIVKVLNETSNEWVPVSQDLTILCEFDSQKL